MPMTRVNKCRLRFSLLLFTLSMACFIASHICHITAYVITAAFLKKQAVLFLVMTVIYGMITHPKKIH